MRQSSAARPTTAFSLSSGPCAVSRASFGETRADLAREATTTPYPVADLLPDAARGALARYPSTITWLCMAGLLEVFVQTVIR